MTGRLQGKVAVVTGAGRGIGRAYAHALAAEGASIVVNDFSDEANTVVREIEARAGTAVANRDDVSNFEAAGDIIQTAINSFGRIDILVANAGILRPAVTHEQSPGDWASTLAVHANGTFNVYRQAVPHMVRQNGGTIITTGAAPLEGYFPGLAAYRAAKAAILVLTLTAANELTAYNININSIMPGSTDTPMQRSFMASMGERAKDWPKGSPPETIPPLGVFLCTDEGREISGYSFHIFGDATVKIVTSFGTRTSIAASGNAWSEGELVSRLPGLLAKAKEAHRGLTVA
jgi:NAD(P)-dependent dehydrogenase (short-subunit alcohol dehydrogenase family)